jgi:T5SS/PEP-CTERM-associated repeat protein/autotransporter-associated beta strand protein
VLANDGNSYSGSTIIAEGTLQLGADYALYYTPVSIAAGATLDFDGYTATLTGLSGEGAVDLGDTGGYFSLDAAGTFAGTLTGQGTVYYENSGTFTLSGDSDFSNGDLYLESGAGRLVSTGNSTFGGLTLSDGAFEVAGGSTVIGGSPSVSTSTDAQLAATGGGSLEIADTLYIGNYSDESGNAVVTGAGSHLQVGDLYVAYSGTGTLTLADGGKLTVESGAGTVHLATGSTGHGTLAIGALSGETAAAPGVVNAASVDTYIDEEEGTGTGLLVFNHTSTDYHFTSDGTAAGTPVLITGATKVVVENGMTYLAAANDYTGGTDITGGGIVIADVGADASVLGTGAVTVASDGGIVGSGTILGAANVAGALLPGMLGDSGPDGTVGRLAFADDLTLASTSGAFFKFGGDERGVSYDAIDVGGDLIYGGTLGLALIDGYMPVTGETFQLFDVTGAHSGAFDNIMFFDAGLTGLFDYGTGSLTITASAVPEPATYPDFRYWGVWHVQSVDPSSGEDKGRHYNALDFGARIFGGGWGGSCKPSRSRSNATSRPGSVWRTSSSSRPSVVGTLTSSSCSVASFSNTTRGIRPAATARSC